MAQVWQERRDEAIESAASVMAAIEHNESFSGRGGALTLALIDKIAARPSPQFDPRNGGFGSQPKFPHPAVLDLLLDIGVNRANEQAREAFTITLEKMARGGVYDQLAGGFHRYSVDERWVVPHFEKMLYDNTELLRNYVHGFQSLSATTFARRPRNRRLARCRHDRPRTGRFFRVAGCRHRPGRRWRLLYLDAGRNARRP